MLQIRTWCFVALLVGCSHEEPPPPGGPPGPDTDLPPVDTGEPAPEPERFILAEASAKGVVRGFDSWHRFGTNIAFGDLTGDGITDIASYAGGQGYGLSYVIPGPFNGVRSAGDAVAEVLDGGIGLHIGDYDGDGQDDLAVASNYFGSTYKIYLGPMEGWWHDATPGITIQPSSSISSGYACDADRDGAADLVMYSTFAPKTYRFALGPYSGATLGDEAIDVVFEGTPDVSEQPGYGILCGYDLTGTGGGDILMPSTDGGVWLIHDPVWSGWQRVADVAELTIMERGDGALAAPGDLTGDGYLDVFNARGEDGQLLDGPISGASQVYATFDWGADVSSVAPVGDLDGDGFDDLVAGLVSTMQHDHLQRGAVYLLHGPIAPGGYGIDDVDLILLPSSSATSFGFEIKADPASGLWGMTASGADDPFPKAGHLYFFEGWPSLD